MATSRRTDEKMLTLLRQGKSFFHIGASGHEGAQLACAMQMNSDLDWSYPYYRDQTMVMGLGMTTEELFLGFLAKADDPGSGGRQLPQHYGQKDLNIVSQSSPTGTQYLQAVGTAMAVRQTNKKSLVYVSSGEGTTSQGEFHEALNWAGREKLPVLFHIEDNGFAISVPKSSQTAEGSVYDMVGGYGNLNRFETDGTDFFESYNTFKEAISSIRAGKGPAIVVSNVVRLLPHSSSDDHRKYRDADELSEEQKRDPIEKFRAQCEQDGIISSEEFQKVWDEILLEVDQVAEKALLAPNPEKTDASTHVVDEASVSIPHSAPVTTGSDIVIVDAVNHALHEEMQRNDKIILYGQDVADGKGGVFTATKGLSTKFGDKRVFNSPLAEASIVGTAVGAAVAGLKPVVEIQFGDYIWTAMMQIRNEVATIRYRSNNTFSCPIVIRTPVGGYIHGGLCHSQSIEGFFMHLPGIHIVYPSNAADAKGLLKYACRIDDPVLFLEHKGMYRQGFAKRPEPDEDYLLPFGQAAVVREGLDLTIVTYGLMVYKAIEAARYLEKSMGASIEVIDLRTLSPLDKITIGQSLQKTSKALVVYEDTLTAGPGAEIAAIIAEEYFEYLDGPVLRVAAKDAPVPFNWDMEDEILPQTEDIRLAAERLLGY
ncbi:MAG: tungsten formylmethanofuran dehydrogenase [Candidatus Marinimicrobia bacterium]|nr:tungsten formylmethanofuran dehydrogenase [Candidatus Neomarinimicrobiota bacterium]MBT3630107.1 tungsten formylmethanofuran dehydrogenase [Candidatus Neomarinimicrobiota bacterium]MBT3826059.1 tungsten formylmethanofuran dehydrogenase [Candidatus Neomarinimicrobiota bacterium]MBT4132093.1 tungsten formylmethanofuran dehydrogenase [Candidatus Neomarinimicrobiota bacterium]MBT4296580.1 tungsten formylmethanofuran dehydrogenase [Candidatus Neomarinimicrobiota bacterium]